MADLTYTVDVNTAGAQRALSGLKSSIGGIASAFAGAFALTEIANVSARFEDLRTTLGVLYKDVETGAQAFDQIKQFATESVFSVEDLTATVVKLKAAGLEPTIDQLRLFADVSSVSADSVGALQAITDLFARTTEGGLGLEDLNRLADRGIPVFKILGDRLGISRLEISKLGQTAEGAQAILAALTEGLSETFDGTSAARAGNLSQAFSNLQDAIANAADAIGEGGFNDALTDAINGVTTFIGKNEALIKTIGEALGIAIRFAADNLKYLAALMAGVFSAAAAGRIIAVVGAVVQLAKGFRDAAIAGTLLQGVTGIGLAKVAAGVAAALGTVALIEEATGDASANIDQLRRDAEALSDGPLIGPLTAPEVPEITTGDSQSQLQIIKDQQDAITRSAINYFDTYRNGVNDLINAVEQESQLLQLTEEQANVQKGLNNFSQQYYNTVRPLQQKLTELKLKDTDEARTQAAEIERQIGLITDLYNTSSDRLRETLELRELNRLAEEKSLLLTETRLNLESDLNDLVRQSSRELRDLSLSPLERDLQQINYEVENTLMASINRLKQSWRNGVLTTDEYIAGIKALEEQAKQAEDTLRENALKTRETQRSFAYGWKEAFESYAEDATNAAKAAERIFEKTTKGMEDAIVNFAKTGKFEFKSLVNSILEELLRSQIQQLFADIFGVFGSGGRGSGGSNFFSDLFAGFFASGGLIPSGKFGVVGENGPELVSGPAQVTPMTGGTAVTYNINAVDASSFKSMVARDPGFIHAVAQQGARKVPVRR